MIKTISIDFWNTIFDSSNSELRTEYRQNELKRILNEESIKIDDSQLKASQKLAWTYFEDKWLNQLRTPSIQEVLEYVFNTLDLQVSNPAFDEIATIFQDSILVHQPKLLPFVKENLDTLKSKGLVLALISDTGFSPGTVLKQLMADYDILHYFDYFSFSDETGVSKPHSKAFNHVLNLSKTDPQNAIHIGDIEHTDIAGALANGMMAIRFLGDKANFSSIKYSTDTKANYSVYSWSEIPQIINLLSDKVKLQH